MGGWDGSGGGRGEVYDGAEEADVVGVWWEMDRKGKKGGDGR